MIASVPAFGLYWPSVKSEKRLGVWIKTNGRMNEKVLAFSFIRPFVLVNLKFNV